uniref:Butyrophilin subfamily 2 member A2 n=1 Tax=Astyanax mexicanus TaxID=7994 RepID=A0A8B9H667_ASTMX
MTDRPKSPSCLSMASGLSADQPINFKEVDNISLRSEMRNHSKYQPLHFKEMDPLYHISKKKDRPESPSCRSEASNYSMDQPTNFKIIEPLEHESKKLDRSESPSCRSEISNCSKDQPTNFKETKPLEHKSKKGRRTGSPSRRSTRSTPSIQRPHHFKESLQSLDSLSQTSGRASSADFSYISMVTDTTSEGTQEPRQNPHSAVPTDVVCDLCTETKHKACKSCMTCLASFCEIHVKDHYTIEAMRRHTLVEVTKNLVILQDNVRLTKTINKERAKNLALKMEIAVLQQKITKLKLPDFICKGKTLKAANVVLDPDTAHCALLISHDGKHVQLGNKTNVHQSAQRFDKSECVLAREGFSSGRHYWQVEVHRDFTIGVTCQSSERKGKINFCPKEGYWCLYHFRQSFTALEDSSIRLQADTLPRVLGVCIDVDEKWVTFYNTETKAHIYTFKDMVLKDGEKIYPVFNITEKTVNLVIRSVKED